MSESGSIWSKRRWLTTIVVLFFAHLFLAFSLGKRGINPSSESTVPIRFRYIDKAASDNFHSLEIPASDPSLFVLPSASGFSGDAWMNVPPTEHRLPAWDPPVDSLSLSAPELGDSVVLAIQRIAPDEPRVAQKTIGPLARLDPFFPVEATPRSASVFEIETARSRLQFLTPPAPLPAWTNSEPLAVSTLEIGVDGTGMVQAKRLVSRSGLSLADVAALRWAGDLRFEPARFPEPDELTWGLIHIHWFTSPITPTNNVPVGFIPSP